MASPLRRFDLEIDDRAFAYLKIQRGSLDHLSGNRPKWEGAYRATLKEDYHDIRPFLPVGCKTVLDVGGGMGGLDVIIGRHYRESVIIALLDGMADEPTVRWHSSTFSNADAARSFLRRNGVGPLIFIDPHRAMAKGVFSPKFDLVISTQAWCFHIAPAIYLDFVAGSCNPGATVILDVRRELTAWHQEIEQRFEKIGVVRDAPKYLRTVYRAN